MKDDVVKFNKKDIINTLLRKQKKYPIEIHNMTSHIGDGCVVLNL